MNTRTIRDVDEIRSIFTDPEWKVRPPDAAVPEGLRDTAAGAVFGAFARMSDGEDHQRRKRVVINRIDQLDMASIHAHTGEVFTSLHPVSPREVQYLVPGMVLAHLFGVPEQQQRPLMEQVRALVIGARPTAREEESAEAIAAMERAIPLVEATLDDSDIEVIASGISLLFQASDACAALIGNALVTLAATPDSTVIDPAEVVRSSMAYRVPVRSTTRVRGDELAILDLEAAHGRYPDAEWTFGFGPHACPGRSIAISIATAVIDCVISLKPFDPGLIRFVGWEALPNVWIPILELRTGATS